MEEIQVVRERIPNIETYGEHQKGPWATLARFVVLVWHRKAWKTSTAICKLIEKADKNPGTYWYVAPYLNQARKIVWEDPEMLQKFLPPSIWDKRNNSGLFVTFPNGSKLYILGADNPDALRGPNPKGVVLDEWDDQDPQIWGAIIQPIMIANPEAWCWFVGTYKGKRDLHSKYMYAVNEMKTKGSLSQWYCSLLKASKSKIIADEDLEEARRTTTEAFFRQEYECEPLDNAAAVFRNIDACTQVIDPKLGVMIPWTGAGEPNPNHKYQIGVDLAKYNDFTVITPFDRMNLRVYKQDRFNQIDWSLQKAKVELSYLKHSRGVLKARMLLDSTGVGDPIFEDLEGKIPGLVGIQFTAQMRDDLLTNLALKIEQGIIKIPNDEVLIGELKAFQYVMKTSNGGKPKIRMEVPENVHDDCVMSLALAVWDTPNEADKDMDAVRQRREDLKNFDAIRNRKGASGSAYLRRQGM